jgi:hypothetical protein
MKTYLMAGIAATLLYACNTPAPDAGDKPKDEAAKPMPQLPKEVLYKGEPSIGSNENMITVINWNKYLEEAKLDSAAALLADSLSVELEDGTVLAGPRDTIMAAVKQMVGMYDSVRVTCVAVLPLNVKTDKGIDEWVFSWTDERYTAKAGGKSAHMNIHEDYLLKNGKIIRVLQYRQVPPKAQ